MSPTSGSKANHISLVVFLSLGILFASVFASGVASSEWPLPISGLILPLFILLGKPFVGSAIFGVFLAFLWFWWFQPLISGNVVLKKSSLYVLSLLFFASAGWYYLCWEAANTVRAPSHVIGCAIINFTFIVIMLVVGMKAIKKRSQQLAVLVRAMTIVWVVTYGFAYFGELP